ncbi:MAG: hypothetical protein OEZ38_11155, partial [Gammaproteobacteria bacterium]|nr:hypothetical protein [Gammaproteobacteria bacterium]
MFSKIKEAYILIFVSSVFLSAIAAIAYVSYSELKITDRVDHQWERFHSASEIKGLLLVDLYEKFGYHGLANQHFHVPEEYKNLRYIDHLMISVDDIRLD